MNDEFQWFNDDGVDDSYEAEWYKEEYDEDQ